MPIIQEIANRIAKYFWERHKKKRAEKKAARLSEQTDTRP